MITVESLHKWKERQDLEAWEKEEECEECDGTGECPCCERECLECDGTGITGLKKLSDKEVEARYFREVMESIKRLCAFSSRHDFLTEAGAFIKQQGRLDLPPWERRKTLH